MGGQDDLATATRAIMAARRDELGEPPTPEELLAFRDGRLADEDRPGIEARIALYPDAARALADLSAFPAVEPAPGTPELSDDEITARWRSFRSRLIPHASPLSETPRLVPPVSPLPGWEVGSGGRGAGGEGPPATKHAAWWRHPGLRLAAAALFGLSVGWAAGFAGRVWTARPGPTINVQIAELAPAEGGGVRSAPVPVELEEGSEELLLVLGVGGPGEDRRFTGYEADVIDAAGRRIWSRQGLRPTDLGTFQLAFHRGALAPGTYRIHLFGHGAGGRVPAGSYSLRLLAGTPPP